MLHTCVVFLTCPVQVLSVLLYIHRDRTDYKDGEPGMSTSTFTQFLSSVRAVLWRCVFCMCWYALLCALHKLQCESFFPFFF